MYGTGENFFKDGLVQSQEIAFPSPSQIQTFQKTDLKSPSNLSLVEPNKIFRRKPKVEKFTPAIERQISPQISVFFERKSLIELLNESKAELE